MAAPQNVAQVEQLVKQLYQPADPQLIRQINDQLLQLQLSQDGWGIADALMASDDPQVRFFAALTFTVKLNHDGPSLDVGAAESILTRLLYWSVRLVRQKEGDLVCRKFCTALTTYFSRIPTTWKNPLLHLAISLHHGDAVAVDAVKNAIDNSKINMGALIPSLSESQTNFLVSFGDSLAEEVQKLDSNSLAHAHVHDEMKNVVEDASVLISLVFERTIVDEPKTARSEALSTFHSWVEYAQSVWYRDTEQLQCLRALVPRAVQLFANPDLRQDTVEVFRDILEVNASFFSLEDVTMIAENINRYIRVPLLESMQNQDLEASALVQLVVSFGCANVEQIVMDYTNPVSSKPIIELLYQVLMAPGYPGEDNEFSTLTLEFWNTFVEHVTDIVHSTDPEEPPESWLEPAKLTIWKAVELLWKKMQMPPNDVADEWDDTACESFREFRMDARDLMLSVYILVEEAMLRACVSRTLESLAKKDWCDVEVALFTLNALADNILEDMSHVHSLGEVFRSDIFRQIADFSQAVPLQLKRTAIDLLGSYGKFLQRHTEFLPDTFRLLFVSLEKSSLADSASRAIASLCDDCRASLTGELDGFLIQYQQLTMLPTVDTHMKTKLVGAIAAIVQALSPESAKGRPMMALLDLIATDVTIAKDSLAGGNAETAEQAGVCALECMASIAKNSGTPDDATIIIDDDEPKSDIPGYWESDEGQALQMRIVDLFSVLQVVGNNSDAIDAACSVLRFGFIENEPGAFVLPASVTVNFLQQCSINTPRLESVLTTVAVLITHHSRSNSKRIPEEVASIYGCVIGLLQALVLPSNDPSVATECIGVVTTMMPHYIHILLGAQVAFLLDFTLAALVGADPMPKKSSAEFWTKIIRPQTATLAQDVQQHIEEVMDAYGERFVSALMRQIGGQASRSEVESLCSPLQAILLHQRNAQPWLQHALTADTFPANHIRPEERQRFLSQVLRLGNDGKRLRDLVKAFWAACRGTVISF